MNWFRSTDTGPDVAGLRLQLIPASVSNGAVVIKDYEAFKLAVVRASDHGPLAVNRTDLAALRLTSGQAFKIAAEATWKQELVRLDVRRYRVGAGHMTTAAIDDCPYVTTALLSLSPWTQPPPAFVCAPAFSTISVIHLTSQADLKLVEGLREVCRSVFEQANNRCDPEIYWFDGRSFRKPRYAEPVGGGTPQPVTPSSLTKLLATLSES